MMFASILKSGLCAVAAMVLAQPQVMQAQMNAHKANKPLTYPIARKSGQDHFLIRGLPPQRVLGPQLSSGVLQVTAQVQDFWLVTRRARQ